MRTNIFISLSTAARNKNAGSNGESKFNFVSFVKLFSRVTVTLCFPTALHEFQLLFIPLYTWYCL